MSACPQALALVEVCTDCSCGKTGVVGVFFDEFGSDCCGVIADHLCSLVVFVPDSVLFVAHQCSDFVRFELVCVSECAWRQFEGLTLGHVSFVVSVTIYGNVGIRVRETNSF